MELVDASNLEQGMAVYGGASCIKIGVDVDGEDYLLKFPGNLKARGLKNVELSCSITPVCEFLGSMIYEILDIPVHSVMLGKRNGKVVALCKDFTAPQARLYEFSKYKATYEPGFTDFYGNVSDGNVSVIDEALLTIRNHAILSKVVGVEERFWQMFIVDALIGNTDRNNDNWGVLVRDREVAGLAPVYDNGNCLNNKWDDGKIAAFMADEQMFLSAAFKGVVCHYTKPDGKKINPFQYLSGNICECAEVCLKDLSQKIADRKDKIFDLIDSADVISEVRQKFYKRLIDVRSQELMRIAKSKIGGGMHCF